MKNLLLQTLTTVLLIHIPLKSDTNHFGEVLDFELELNDSEIPLISQEEKGVYLILNALTLIRNWEVVMTFSVGKDKKNCNLVKQFSLLQVSDQSFAHLFNCIY